MHLISIFGSMGEAPSQPEKSSLSDGIVRLNQILGKCAPVVGVLNILLFAYVARLNRTLENQIDFYDLQIEELSRQTSEAADYRSIEAQKFTPCSGNERGDIGLVQRYINGHFSDLLIAEFADLPSFVPTADIADALDAAGEADVFCTPWEEYTENYDLLTDGVTTRTTLAETLHYQTEDRPGSLTVYPVFFEADFCAKVGYVVHEGAHIATGALHYDGGQDWMYDMGDIAEEYCLQHPTVNK